MRPILAVIPAFPSQFLIPTILITALLGLAAAARLKNAAPLVFAGGIAFVAWLWSRQPITLHSYGFFLVIGFFLSVWLACLEAKRRGYDPNIVLDLSMPLLLVSIVLCRILYFLVYPSQWRGFGEFLQIWNGGLSFHGAIVGALVTIGYFAWKRGVKYGTLCDIIAPGIFAGYAIGRVGCFFNGCCYGFPTDVAWAVRFHVEGSNDPNAFTVPSHPAQLYSTGLSLVLFSLMWWARKQPRLNRFPRSTDDNFAGALRLRARLCRVLPPGSHGASGAGHGMDYARAVGFGSGVAGVGSCLFCVVEARAQSALEGNRRIATQFRFNRRQTCRSCFRPLKAPMSSASSAGAAKFRPRL